MNTQTRVYIDHDASDDAMGFNSETHEKYDFTASLDRYEEMLEAEVLKEWPGADVTILRNGSGHYWVNGEADSDDAGMLSTIVADLFGGYEWLVERNNPFGCVTYNGETYILDEQADYTNRLFYGSFNDRYEDGSYEDEFAAAAHDINGNEFRVIWHFTVKPSDDPIEDLSNLPWDADHIFDVVQA